MHMNNTITKSLRFYLDLLAGVYINNKLALADHTLVNSSTPKAGGKEN